MKEHLDEALAALRNLGRERDMNVTVYVRCDGRIQFDFEDRYGCVQHSVRADLEPGGADPLPSGALNAFRPPPRSR